MQTNFSSGFSGVFAAAPRAPGTASSRSRNARGSGEAFTHLYSQNSKTTVQNCTGLQSVLHLRALQAS